MRRSFIVVSAIAVSMATAGVARADEKAPPPRRSIPAMIAGASGLSAGLTVVAVSGIIAATQPCVTLPNVPSGCDPTFDNTYAVPLLLAGGALTVLSIPILSIGLERDTGPLDVSKRPAPVTVALGVGSVTATWSF